VVGARARAGHTRALCDGPVKLVRRALQTTK
jgi:hypothetical protein